jgi:hypothetical protein
VHRISNKDAAKTDRNDVRISARDALMKIMVPLAGFVSDSGLSAGELAGIFREAAVRNAAARQLETSSRINISGISATTGISRAEVSKILKSKSGKVEQISDAQQQSTNRILAAWHEDPKFSGVNGSPLDLDIYGRGATFEALSRKYGRGIPTRAVLDELLRSGAIELLPTQKIRAKASMSVEAGFGARAIKALGDRASELLSTMLANMRKPDTPKFVATVSNAAFSSDSLPLLRRELSSRSSDFLADVQEVFSRKSGGIVSKRTPITLGRVSVTIFYHELFDRVEEEILIKSKRRNFRRDSKSALG